MARSRASSDHAQYGVVVLGSGPAGQRAAIASVKSVKSAQPLEKVKVRVGSIGRLSVSAYPRYSSLTRTPAGVR